MNSNWIFAYFSADIRMDDRHKMCAALYMERVKIKCIDKLMITRGVVMAQIGVTGYRYLGVLGIDE